MFGLFLQLLRMCYNYDLYSHRFVLSGGVSLTDELARQIGLGDVIADLVEFAKMLASMRMDQTMIALLSAFCFFSAGQSNEIFGNSHFLRNVLANVLEYVFLTIIMFFVFALLSRSSWPGEHTGNRIVTKSHFAGVEGVGDSPSAHETVQLHSSVDAACQTAYGRCKMWVSFRNCTLAD